MFTTPKEAFKPTVIFSGLTNSLVTFQTIMNEILWGLINTGKVVSFIDNIIVETKEEKEHDEIVKEVIKRLAEKNLYMKLEKCKWKVRKVGFLGIVIGLKRIEIEEEKMKSVLNWLISKGVKDIQKFLSLANYYQQFIKDFVSIAKLVRIVNDRLYFIFSFPILFYFILILFRVMV